MNILVVENDETQQIILGKVFKNALPKAKVVFCQTALSAYHYAADHKFDLVIIDYLLDSETGLDVIKKLRGTHNRETKTLLWSATYDYVELFNELPNVYACSKPKKTLDVMGIILKALVRK